MQLPVHPLFWSQVFLSPLASFFPSFLPFSLLLGLNLNHPPVCMSVCLPIHYSIHQSTHLSVSCTTVCLSVHALIHPFICLLHVFLSPSFYCVFPENIHTSPTKGILSKKPPPPTTLWKFQFSFFNFCNYFGLTKLPTAPSPRIFQSLPWRGEEYGYFL